MIGKPTPKQKVARLRKWINALRSGKYKKCTGILQKHDKNGISYCVLGVGAAAAGLNRWNGDYEDIYRYYGLSPAIFYPLVNRNDTQGLEFPELAKYIESHYLKSALDKLAAIE